MALLIDTPRWSWRNQLWAHLVSDESLDELHEAAREVGLRWVTFGRDHYDVPESLWPEVCKRATLVDSRVIVRSLRASGLRVPGGKPVKAWRREASVPAEFRTPEIDRWLDEVRGRLGIPGSAASIDCLTRPGEAVVLHLLDHDRRPSLGDLVEPPAGASRVVETLAQGRYSVELILEKQSSIPSSTMPSRPLR